MQNFHGKVLILDETIILSLSSFMFIDEIIVIDPIRMFYRNSRYKFLNKKRDKIIAKIQRRHCVFPRITTGKRIDFYVGICRNSKKTKKEISESPIYSWIIHNSVVSYPDDRRRQHMHARSRVFTQKKSHTQTQSYTHACIHI